MGVTYHHAELTWRVWVLVRLSGCVEGAFQAHMAEMAL